MDRPRDNIIEDPQNAALQHPGGGQDEGEHNVEKQSLFKRVKAKAKKMKESFKGHGHDHDRDVDDVDDEDVDGGQDINLDDHTAPGMLSTGVPGTGEMEEFGMHEDKPSILEKDPHASGDVGENRNAETYQTEVADPNGRGGEGIGESPILHELGKMNIHEESTQKLDPNVNKGKQEHQDIFIGNHDQFFPEAVTKPQLDATIPISQGLHGEKEQKPESYNDEVSHENPTDADSTVSFDQQSDQEPLNKKPVTGGYGETVSSISSSIINTAGLAKDVVVSKLGYGETQEESGSEFQTGSTDSSFHKEALVKQDGSLSKVSNEVLPLHKATEEIPIDEGTKVAKEEQERELGEEKKVVVKGKVTESEEVANSLGKAEDTNYDDAGPGLASPGKSVMDRLRDAAGSWFNQSGGEVHVEPQVELGDSIEEGNDKSQASTVKEIGLH